MNRLTLRHALSEIVLHGVLLTIGILFLLPFVWSVATSLKPLRDLFQVTPSLIPSEMRWQNYTDVLDAVPAAVVSDASCEVLWAALMVSLSWRSSGVLPGNHATRGGGAASWWRGRTA